MKSEKVVVVTGSSRGIGAATAIVFASNGYSVCINYKTNVKAADKVVTEVQKYGVSCISGHL